MQSASQETDDPITQINVVPLVDIMLVLLIIFMLTASFIVTPSLPINVPKAFTSEPTAPSALPLHLTKEGKLLYRAQSIERPELKRVLTSKAVTDPEARVVLTSDTTLSYGSVVELLDFVRSCGIRKVALGVQKP